MGRELGEGEIRVKRVVLTALRAWLAVVIITLSLSVRAVLSGAMAAYGASWCPPGF